MAYSAINFTLLNDDDYGYCPLKTENSYAYPYCNGPSCPVSVASENDRYCAFAVIPGILYSMNQNIKRIGGER